MKLSDPVLAKLGTDVRAHFGPRLDRIVLYGSRARGDAKPDSDYDVAIFVKNLQGRWPESAAVADIQIAILDATGATVNAMLYPDGHWRSASSPLMHEIRKDGLDI